MKSLSTNVFIHAPLVAPPAFDLAVVITSAVTWRKRSMYLVSTSGLRAVHRIGTVLQILA